MLKLCIELDLDKTATKDVFVRYDFASGEVIKPRKELVQMEEQALVRGETSKDVKRATVSVIF